MLFNYKIPPLALAGFFAALMYFINFYVTPYNMSYVVKITISLILLLSGLIFIVLGIGKFRRHKTTVNPMKPESTTVLVTSGIYSITRNPMYVGFVFLLLGWGIYLSNLVSILVVIVFFIYMNFVQIVYEESILEKQFGESYHQYKSRVRRWL